MAEELTQHIESFVDSSRSEVLKAASLDAIVSLVKTDVLTIEALVREMSMYLTTTDNVIRARGILLLAELLTCVASKHLDNATIHSLIGFFTDRLADWKALRGALVGCLAMLRRTSNAGMVANADAKAVTESYLVNVQAQSLAQHDRKLCYEILECLLERYGDAIVSLGDDLIYGICEAIDGEKDPQCLMLAFHIVKLLAGVFSDSDGQLVNFAADLIENLGCYFPVHFTHPKGEDVNVKRDDLSRALMLAFSSTPLFEPFVVPLLLEKLSSSLPLAKVESLKYLNDCTLNYGRERMEKYAGPIWSSLKDVMYTSQQEPTLSFATLDDVDFQDVEIETEALTFLQNVIMQNNGLSLVVGDEDINMIFNSITSYKNYNDISSQSKKKLFATGRILHVSAKTSISTCNKVFESFFPLLMNSLGLSLKDLNEHLVLNERLNFGALYLCIELLAACRDSIVAVELASDVVCVNETCYTMVQKFSTSLIKAFDYILRKTYEHSHNADIYLGVKGLQILATFPGTISKSTVEYILVAFMSIITEDFGKSYLWKLVLKAVVNIGSFIDKYHESEMALIYTGIVVDKMVSLLSHEDFSLRSPLKLEAISDIGSSGRNYMLKIIQGLEEAIFANLSEVYVHGNLKSAQTNIWLLECYSNKVLPWIEKTGGFEEVLLRFAVGIWSQIENCTAFSAGLQEKELLEAMMTAVKFAVGSCSEDSQNIIVQKAYSVLSASTSFPFMEFTSNTIPIQLEGLKLNHGADSFSHKDQWILSLFASVIIAVRPQTRIPNARVILHLFMITLLKGHVPAAQALGSMVNKLCLKSNGAGVSCDCTLEDAIDMIFKTKGWKSHDDWHLRCNEMNNDNEIGLLYLCLGDVNKKSLQIHAVVGLAWVGKGLLLCGHEKIKDITMAFLECLLWNGGVGALSSEEDVLKESHEQQMHLSVMKCAADAFHILMSDSEVCLNRKFHAMVRPLYKQRFFSTIMPILLSLIVKADSSFSRAMLYRACAHVISDTPLSVILGEAKKLLPIMMNSLSLLTEDIMDKDMIYSLLLVLSGILTDKNGQEAVTENAHIIINGLIKLVSYPHMMLVRETAIQCLVALSGLPHAKIYPMRTQVLQAISNALDDPKRSVRQEAVRCRQSWASNSSRSLRF